MTALAGKIAAAFIAACRDELEAPKPGNVHVLSSANRKTAADFVRSAEAAAAPLTRPGTCVGARILGAVEATCAVVPRNTNLGIILLCAPLAAAAERAVDLRAAVAAELGGLNVDDARLAFRAIVLAAPGGLGTVTRHDVRVPATVGLREAMAEAADRDRIARQFSGFADVFELGEPLLKSALPQAAEPKWATLAVYLRFLAAFPDSHVAREHGPAIAEEVRARAAKFCARLGQIGDMSHLLPDLMTWDAALKQRGVNPGTSADLTVATLFLHEIRSILPTARNSD